MDREEAVDPPGVAVGGEEAVPERLSRRGCSRDRDRSRREERGEIRGRSGGGRRRRIVCLEHEPCVHRHGCVGGRDHGVAFEFDQRVAELLDESTRPGDGREQ